MRNNSGPVLKVRLSTNVSSCFDCQPLRTKNYTILWHNFGLDKPVHVGMKILGNSNILMYEFFFEILKKGYGNHCEFLCTNTWNSLLVEMQTENIYDTLEKARG